MSLRRHNEVGENCRLDLTAVIEIKHHGQGEEKALLADAVRNRKPTDSEEEEAYPSLLCTP